ncbi:hypothetical protein [Desulfotalea psychrophila]|uniref:hypothetical protein n=1 Tax=Desulfotalea psychrophila TaxID=84980 RepID=UPI0006748E9E|nr:hypothetical protein [Desulfotalea psychrophila]
MILLGRGQPSTDHLGGYIAKVVRPLIKKKAEAFNDQYAGTDDSGERAEILEKLKALNQLGADYFVGTFLLPGENPSITYLLQPAGDDPFLLRQSPHEMIVALPKIHSINSFTLNTVNLAQADVIEILYECRGGIRCIEFFSLRDLTQKRFRDGEALAELKTALNKADVVALKHIIINNIDQVCFGDTVCEQASDEVVSLRDILNDINTLAEMYVRQPLQTYIGSGSTGNFASTFGMGFVVLETLPVRAQREYARSVQHQGVFCVPINTEVWEKFTYKPKKGITDLGKRFLAFTKSSPFFKRLGQTCVKSYLATEIKVARGGKCGNIGLLGGRSLASNGFAIKAAEIIEPKRGQRIPLRYLNSTVLNWLKVLVGFIPAFLTFSLTKDWWLLSYLGAFIWFGITGGRNIIQAVVGGGGGRNISLLHWHEYVDWNRVSDSLLYTGFSVPLLDWLCKTVVLDQGFGVNISNNALLLYTVMSITNGFYICSHNLFRGLPPKAVFGNFFRSLLSIPVAVLFSWVIGGILGACGIATAGIILQKWAAVISKFASDCVGGIIEGGADRGANVHMRVWDYQTKFKRVLQLYTKIEILFPERNVLRVMSKPDKFLAELRERRSGLEKALIFDSLDFLTLWLYQPRASTALEHILRQMTTEERCVFFMSQLVLTQEREVSQLLLAGSLGERFARALSFYLDSYRRYLRGLDALMEKIGTTEHRELCGEKPWEISDLRLGF